MPRPDGAHGPPLPDPAAPGAGRFLRPPAAPRRAVETGGAAGPLPCPGPAPPGPSVGPQPGMCPALAARTGAARDAGPCAARRARASRVLRCCFRLQALVSGYCHWQQSGLVPILVIEYLKAAVGPACYLQGCAPGHESAAVKGEAEEVSSLGLLVTVIIMVEGVLETQKGSLSIGSRSHKELATCNESYHPAWMARSWGDLVSSLGPNTISLS